MKGLVSKETVFSCMSLGKCNIVEINLKGQIFTIKSNKADALSTSPMSEQMLNIKFPLREH